MADEKTKTTEARVAQALLQEPIKVTLGGKVYDVAQPTLGTLIAASEYIAQLPEPITPKEGREVSDILARACDFKLLPKIVATLIVGVKGGSERFDAEAEGVIKAKPKGLRRWLKNRKLGQSQSKIDHMERVIYDEASPREVENALVALLRNLQLQDFFVCTTFLQGIRMTRPTKVVEETKTEATARGRS